MNIHLCYLYVPFYGIVGLHLVNMAHGATLIRGQSPTNCDVRLPKAIFKYALGGIAACSGSVAVIFILNYDEKCDILLTMSGICYQALYLLQRCFSEVK